MGVGLILLFLPPSLFNYSLYRYIVNHSSHGLRIKDPSYFQSYLDISKSKTERGGGDGGSINQVWSLKPYSTQDRDRDHDHDVDYGHDYDYDYDISTGIINLSLVKPWTQL